MKQVTDWWLGSSGSLTSREEPELPLNAVFDVMVQADIRELCSVFNGNLGTHTYYTGKKSGFCQRLGKDCSAHSRTFMTQQWAKLRVPFDVRESELSHFEPLTFRLTTS